MAGSAAEFQLLNSNIAVPIGFESTGSIGTQIIVVFIVGWTGAGLLFYSVRRYYLKKSKFRGMEDYPDENGKSAAAKSKKSDPSQVRTSARKGLYLLGKRGGLVSNEETKQGNN